MKEKDHLAENILLKVQQGTANEEELEFFDAWYAQYQASAPKVYPQEEIEKIRREIGAKLPVPVGGISKQISLWTRISVVAASIAIVCSAVYFFLNHKDPVAPAVVTAVQKDFPPGKVGATLTLRNGKKIFIAEMQDGMLSREAGVSISKTKDGQIIYTVDKRTSAGPGAAGTFNTLETTRGEQVQVRLPDGTAVYLNAASSLKYPPSFAGMDKREVSLTGEAFFEVARDSSHPFTVKAGKQTVKVLGTHFNINSYEDEGNIRTTLLEGRIRINDQIVLKPGEQATLKGDRLQVTQVDPEAFVAWKNGLFQFEDAPLETVMRQVSRWYDVEVVYAPGLQPRKFNGKVFRNMTLSKVLQVLSLSKVNYRIQGRQIVILN